MDEFLSLRDFTTTTAGSHVAINVPDITSATGFRTKKINVPDLVAGAGSTPLKLKNVSSNISQVLPGDSYIDKFGITKISGTPVIKIGTTVNGNDILDTTTIEDFLPIIMQSYIDVDTTYYFTISGGTINIRFDFQINYAL